MQAADAADIPVRVARGTQDDGHHLRGVLILNIERGASPGAVLGSEHYRPEDRAGFG